MKYSEIMDSSYIPPRSRPRMSREMRAAQFAPFAALTGFDDDIAEAGRLTDRREVLFDDEIFELNERLRMIEESLEGGKRPFVEVVCFQADAMKDGGAYKTRSGVVRRVDEVMGEIVFEDRMIVRIENVVEIGEIE